MRWLLVKLMRFFAVDASKSFRLATYRFRKIIEMVRFRARSCLCARPRVRPATYFDAAAGDWANAHSSDGSALLFPERVGPIKPTGQRDVAHAGQGIRFEEPARPVGL